MLVRLNHVYKIYGEGLESEVRALDDVSLTIDRGEFVAIVGQSGSGKSTMMNVLGCLDIPTRGDYFLDGTDVRELTDRELSRIRNKQIGFIFQQYNLIQSLTVLENVLLPCSLYGIRDRDTEERARTLLEQMGIGHLAEVMPSHLSGGETRRVAIARAMIRRPSILLADEPTGDLDDENTEVTSKSLLKYAAKKKIDVTGFVKSIPMEIEEAAAMDGCNPITLFFRVIFPILRPTAVTVAI